MNWLTILQLLLSLAGGLVSALTTAGAPAEIITLAENALKALSDIEASPVTNDQLAGLRFTPKW